MKRILKTLLFILLLTFILALASQAGPVLKAEGGGQPGTGAEDARSAQPSTLEETLYLPALRAGNAASEALTPQERMQAITDIQTRLETLLPPASTAPDQRDLAAEVELLGQELVKLPQVLATVVQTRTLTAHAILSDGLVVTIINNRPPGADAYHASRLPFATSTIINNRPPGADASPPELVQVRRTVETQVAAQQAVPESNRAVVAHFDGGAAVAAEVRGMLQDAGYDVLGLGASINAMRNYKNLGALYLDTHGASFLTVQGIRTRSDGSKGPITGDSVYALETSTQVSAGAIENLWDDLHGGRVVVNFVQEEDGWQAKLAITEHFIARNWSFDHGVVMLHACFGGSGPFNPGSECNGGCFPGDAGVFDPTPLRQAMLGAGADAVISFDNYTNAPQARPSILLFFDRMLGADREKRKDPPLRPFGLSEVWRELGQENLLTFQKPSYTLFGGGIGGNSVNLTQDVGDSSVSLAPGIQYVDVIDDAAQNQGKLEIVGQFGQRQGSVELDGQSLAIESWAADKIVARSGFSGPGAAGDLIVKAPPEVESNPVPISEWTGTVTLTFDPNRGSLQAVADTELHFRADLHAFRETIDGAAETREVDAYISGASEGEVRASGSYSDDDVTETWSGGGPMEVMSKAKVDIFAGSNGGAANSASLRNISPQAAGELGGLITLDPEMDKARLCLWMQGSFDVTYTGAPQSFPFGFFLPHEELADSTRGLLGCIDTILRADYSIPGGERSWSDPAVGELYKLEWSEFQPVAPPTDDTPG